MSTLAPLAGDALDRLGPAERERVEATARREGIAPALLASVDQEPRRLERFLTFYDALIEDALGDRRLKDVVHARVAELDALERAYALPRSPSELAPPPGLGADELAVVGLLDALAVDHLAVPPERFDALRAHFDDAQVMELLWAVAVARSMARAGAALGAPFRA